MISSRGDFNPEEQHTFDGNSGSARSRQLKDKQVLNEDQQAIQAGLKGASAMPLADCNLG